MVWNQARIRPSSSIPRTRICERKSYGRNPFWLALLNALAGDREKCLDWLEKQYETKNPNLSYIAGCDCGSMLREESRYQELLRKMNLPGGENSQPILEKVGDVKWSVVAGWRQTFGLCCTESRKEV